MRGFSYIGFFVLAAFLVLFPLFVKSTYYLGIMIVIAIYAMVTVGLCLLMGYAGQVSLGHAAFYGIGAYASAILTAHYGLNPWLAMLMAALMTGLVAFVLGIPTLKLKEHYLALATLGLGIIVFIFFNETIWLTGGPGGVTGIPYLRIGGLVFKNDFTYYYLVWFGAIVAILLAHNLVNSRVGRALRAIHGSEIAAQSMAVNTSQYKLQVFVLSAIYGSVAGSLYAHYVTFVNPAPFGFMASIQFVVMAVVGGLASIWGPLFGVTAIVVLGEILRDVVPKVIPHARGEYEIIVFGIILILVMIFMPEGLARGLLNLYERGRLYMELRRKSEDGQPGVLP